MNRESVHNEAGCDFPDGETHTMIVLMSGAGAVGVSETAKLSRVCMVQAVCRKKTVEYLACLKDVRLASALPHSPPRMQDISRERKTGIGLLNGTVIRKGREHDVPAPLDPRIASLARFSEPLIPAGCT